MRESVGTYPRAAVERAMKVQEVILRAMGKKINWWQAAEIIGISERQMRRWRERYEEHGYDGLIDRRRGRPSQKRLPWRSRAGAGALPGGVLCPERAAFHEKFGAEHGIHLSYTWVKLALQGAGLVAKARKRGIHRKGRTAPVAGHIAAHRRQLHSGFK